MNKFTSVKKFFENDLYLKNKSNILIRRSIVRELARNINDKRIMDIGCGDGSISLQFAPENQVTLIDGSEFMIGKAREIARKTHLTNVNFLNIDYFDFNKSEQFELIICIGVVSHVENVSRLLQEIRNHLTDDGLLIIQFSRIDHFYYRKFQKNRLKHDDAYGYSLNTFTNDEFVSLLSSFDYQILKTRGYSWPVKPFSLMPSILQYYVLNFLRKIPVFSFLNSEQILLLKKRNSQIS